MRWRGVLGALVGVLFLVPLWARADVPTVIQAGTITTTGATPWLALDGQSSCIVTLAGTGAGLTITAQGSSVRPPASPVTITNIGSSGVMSANGPYPATSGVGQYALTGVRLNVSAISSGSETYTIACSGAAPPSSGGGTVTAVVSPIPLPVVVPTQAVGLAIPVAAWCPSAAPVASNGAYSCTIGSDGKLQVNTPAPAPTGAAGVVAIEPKTGGGWTPLVQANPSSSPVPVKGSAGTLGGVAFWNGAAATQFIQIFNLLPGGITLGSTAPLKVLPCPTVTLCFLPLPAFGAAMGTGITMYCTTTSTGSSGCATGTQLMVDYLYRPRDPCREAPSFHLRPPPFFLRLPDRRCSSP